MKQIPSQWCYPWQYLLERWDMNMNANFNLEMQAGYQQLPFPNHMTSLERSYFSLQACYLPNAPSQSNCNGRNLTVQARPLQQKHFCFLVVTWEKSIIFSVQILQVSMYNEKDTKISNSCPWIVTFEYSKRSTLLNFIWSRFICTIADSK